MRPGAGVRAILVLGTLNAAKGRELVSLLGDVRLQVRLLADYPGARLPEETGQTYAENALAKARAAAGFTGELSLGDDSGLEVDALGGEPGLYTARFGGAGLDDRGRWALLLDRLRGVELAQRTARFRCVVALAGPGRAEQVVEGVAEGVIATAPRGSGGFGYDPVFFYPPLGRTFAEISDEEKARVSHRGRALAALRRLLIG
ncbi:MAG: non-canonical purine NTP pyrophosphatase, RdgB/HAM1 family [Candidatus Rokuibacteriota bacterium]|nr:MAG: non-canonical purine NTP pyrophosphatase, RdgB/HAM1 family [Candidatus Rokubacteria bacterium]PYN71959.1 MAG: non-canonical purine NTP pyrophosphatase, RdgB/HAM1 family [Candidatus Rokubacteria bacterium]